MSEQSFEPLCCGSLVNQQDILVRWPLGALRLADNVNDPPTWCGAVWTTLCGGCGEPHPLWRSSLVEPGAKVTVIVFTEETWGPSSSLVSATTTWM